MARQTQNFKLWLPDIGTGNVATLLNQNFEKIDLAIASVKIENEGEGYNSSVIGDFTIHDKNKRTNTVLSTIDEGVLEISAKDISLKKNDGITISISTKFDEIDKNIQGIGTWDSSTTSTEFDKAKNYYGSFTKTGDSSVDGQFANVKTYYGSYSTGNETPQLTQVKNAIANIGTWDNSVSSTEFGKVKDYYGTYALDGAGQMGDVHAAITKIGTYTPLFSEDPEGGPLSNIEFGKVQCDIAHLDARLTSLGFKTGACLCPAQVENANMTVHVPIYMQGNYMIIDFSQPADDNDGTAVDPKQIRYKAKETYHMYYTEENTWVPDISKPLSSPETRTITVYNTEGLFLHLNFTKDSNLITTDGIGSQILCNLGLGKGVGE